MICSVFGPFRNQSPMLLLVLPQMTFSSGVSLFFLFIFYVWSVFSPVGSLVTLLKLLYYDEVRQNRSYFNDNFGRMVKISLLMVYISLKVNTKIL